MKTVQLKLREASVVLGVTPKDLQNLVQFGVLRPQRKNRFFVFDRGLLLEAKVAFYLREALGTSIPLLARFTEEIFKDVRRTKEDRLRNVSVLSRPARGREAIRIEIPLQALAAELEAQLPAPAPPSKGKTGKRREGWKDEIAQTFEKVSGSLKGVTEQEILNSIKEYRAQRRKTPEITVVALPQKKTA